MTIAIIRAEDYSKVSTDQRQWAKDVAAYIDEAPDGSNFAQEPMWQRQTGLTSPEKKTGAIRNPTVSDWTEVWIEEINSTHNKDLYAPSQWVKENMRNLRYFKLAPSRIAKDRRVAYKSTNFPYIVSGHHFYNNAELGFDVLNLRFSIPEGSLPGHYLLIWAWRGYSDCVDIEHRPEEVTHVNGKIATGDQAAMFTWNRVDHCIHETPKRMITTCHNTIEECFDAVKDWSFADKIAINAVPMINPAGVSDYVDRYPEIYGAHRSQCGSGSPLRLNGTVTLSSSDWEAKWMAKSTKLEDQRCKSNIRYFIAKTLRQAVLACSEKLCAGISYRTRTSVTEYWGCKELGEASDATQAGTGYTAIMKKERPSCAKCGGNQSYTHDLYNNNEWEIVAKIQFGTGTKSGFSQDAGAVFGARENNLKYGWKCKHTQMFSDSVNYVHEPCGCEITEEIKKVGWAYEPPAPCTRNKWELEVDNGWYRITGTGGHITELQGCAIEGTQFDDKVNSPFPIPAVSRQNPFESMVKVADGRLTLEAIGFPNDQNGRILWGCKKIHALVVEKMAAGGTEPPAAWMPSEDSPWQQMELAQSTPVGVVSLTVADKCEGAWLFRGDNVCLDFPENYKGRWGRISGIWEDTNNRNAIVGVSDTPCTGTKCDQGKICGQLLKPPGPSGLVFPEGLEAGQSGNAAPSSTKEMANIIAVDCAGKTGKYVFVQLPGAGRIIAAEMTVARHRPADADEGKFICYGVEPRAANTTDEAYLISDDPEDPAFYSTCWTREKNLEFLPPLEAPTPRNPKYHFNGKCLTCDNFEKNKNISDAQVPGDWEFTERCKPCN